MKKFIKIVIVYSIGVVSVLALAHRVSRIDSLTNNNSLVDNSNISISYYN